VGHAARLRRATRATALLLAWALAVAGADAVVIVRGDADPKPAKATTSTSVTVAQTTTTRAPTQTTSVALSGEVVVARVTGDGETPATLSFHTTGRWEIRWRVDDAGPGAAITVDDDDRGNQRLFTGLLPGQGTLDVEEGCNCTLGVTPDGSGYDVTVVDVEG
jgi:hypothetical protein